jgi:hypothetical protein
MTVNWVSHQEVYEGNLHAQLDSNAEDNFILFTFCYENEQR